MGKQEIYFLLIEKEFSLCNRKLFSPRLFRNFFLQKKNKTKKRKSKNG